jgi:hypothetical protein
MRFGPAPSCLVFGACGHSFVLGPAAPGPSRPGPSHRSGRKTPGRVVGLITLGLRPAPPARFPACDGRTPASLIGVCPSTGMLTVSGKEESGSVVACILPFICVQAFRRSCFSSRSDLPPHDDVREEVAGQSHRRSHRTVAGPRRLRGWRPRHSSSCRTPSTAGRLCPFVLTWLLMRPPPPAFRHPCGMSFRRSTCGAG